MGKIFLAGLKFLGWVYYYQPYFLKKSWGKLLGFFLRALRLRASVVRKNLDIAFPKDPLIKNDLFKAAYFHLATLFFEVLMLFGPLPYFIRKKVRVIGMENWKKITAKGQGVFFVSSHVGNWEIMAAIAYHYEMDLMLVTKKLKPAWLHHAIEDARARLGVKAAYEPKTLKDIFAHLKKGGAVGFVLDQYTGPPVSVRVPFFGVPVGTSAVLATLVKRTGAPVLPVVNYRDAKGGHVIEIGAPLEWISRENIDTEIVANTAHYVSILETHVRAHPEQWLWIHNRFKGDLSTEIGKNFGRRQ